MVFIWPKRGGRKKVLLFYWLQQGQSCIIPYDKRYKCYNYNSVRALRNNICRHAKKDGKKFITRKHMAGIEVTRIL